MGSTEKVIPGEGTYVISPDGTVTFTPEANFVGKGTEEGNDIPGYPTEDGEQPKKDIPGYRFVETKTCS
ncbi:hypothetical protein V470_10960 [Streptococcus sp. VT 162]|nr:hypothetical protein V470_10960 [Streptococcus sp. VT 162]